MRLASLVSVLLSSLLFACTGNSNAQIDKQPVALQTLQQQWQLVSVDNQLIEAKSSLKIDAQANASGMLACNNFFGMLELQGSQLRINKMGHTRKQCRPDLNALEVIVGSTLSNWSEVTFSQQQLILNSAKHTLIYHIK